MKRRHRILSTAAFYTWFATLPALAQELRRIHYGTTASVSHLPVWVAKDAGLFAKKGLNVEPVQIRGGALITMGIMSGNSSFLARERSRWLLRALKGATSFCSRVPPTWK